MHMHIMRLMVYLVFAVGGVASAGWFDSLTHAIAAPVTNTGATAANASAVAGLPLSEQDVAAGLKVALSNGVNRAVSQLGCTGGFLTNLAVRIPMPAEMQRIELALRAAKQDQLADSFVATMNHAAEKAVVEAAPVFANAVTAMTWQDARGILSGPPDAATQYLRRTGGAQLEQRFLPVVRDATAQTGVTSAYKVFKSAAPKSVTTFFGADTFDVDTYVTRKAMDGLFQLVAAEEKRIRANPLAQTSDLLQRVFGAVVPVAK
ncbi:MAG: DUF4197 domain-containing protein [Kiritimatiellia bacterium]